MRFPKPLSLATLLLLACGGVQAAEHIDAVIPDTLGPGQAAELRLEVSHWQPDSQLLLVPGGPYTSHRLTLPARPTAIATDGRRAFVASQGGLLQIIEFPTAEAARITGQLNLEGEITGLYLNGRRLLVTLAGVGATLLDVALPTEIVQLWTYHRSGTIRDAILGDNEAYLLGESEIERLSFEDMAPTEPAQRWPLPVNAKHFALQGDTALVTSPEGLSSLALEDGQARLLDQHPTNGQPQDLHLEAGLALVNDGPGGLLVFDAQDPAKLRWLGSHSKRGPITALASDADHAWVGLENQSLLAIALGKPQLPAAQSSLRLDAPLVALAAAGDTVFAATEQGVQRLSFATPAVEDISPEGVNLGGSRRGAIRDDILYVADWFSGLHLYDISDPHRPRHLGNYHTPGSSKGVALMDNYALVGDDDQGLQIIDISNPRSPRHVAELSTPTGLAYTMKRLGTTLYLADHRGGFQIIDLSDIEHPRLLGVLDTPGKSWAIDVLEKGASRTAFVADDNDGLLVFDVTDPAHISLIGRFNPGGHAEDIVIRGNLAYMAFFDGGLYILDISNPRQPRPLGQLDIPGNARGIQLVDGLAYVSGWESGLQIVDIRKPAAPRIIGSYDTRGATWGVNVEGDDAFLLDWWGGIQVVDVSMPTRPRLAGRYQARGNLQRLRTKGNYLFAASGAGGLQVFDSRNPLNPIWSRGIDLPGEANDLWLDEDRAYVALADGGLCILDTLDPFYTRPIGGLETSAPVDLVRAIGDNVFLANHQQGLRVMDARDPRHLVELARINQPINDLWLDDTGLFIAGPNGLQLLAVADDGALQPLARYPSDEVRLVRSQGDLSAVVLGDGSVQLLRYADGAFSPLGHLSLHEPLTDLQLAGERLYLLGTRSGLLVADISTPDSPRLTLRYPATGEHSSFTLTPRAAFFAGETRLASVQLLPPVRLTSLGHNQLQLALPGGLPAGHYHLETHSGGGQVSLLPNAIESSYSRPGSKKYNLKTLKSLMKQPLKPPPGP